MPAMSKPALSCKVVVRPLPEQTDAARDQYAYAYTITITNSGDTAAQLIARQWWIADHGGQVQEVRGLGLVGHQPLLNPGESFEYSSWAQIATPMGTMRGSYICITHDAHWFEAEVPEFLLADPAALH